jgi:hypothetical protein
MCIVTLPCVVAQIKQYRYPAHQKLPRRGAFAISRLSPSCEAAGMAMRL